MMLMIGTSALAEQLYSAWRERKDFANPLPSDADYEGWVYVGRRHRSVWRARRTITRLRWQHLTTQQQDVWKHVADAAGRVMADAMGALP